ncbi:hypothetical protein DFJ74DRAFT_689129 [Hyaloraphidium curvatum]|nr:hypothetical protein DFJ74DRAFT_689129 [Hyaloraphidium curvatum]
MATAVPIPGRGAGPPGGGASVGDSLLRKALSGAAGSPSQSPRSPAASPARHLAAGSLGSAASKSASPRDSASLRSVPASLQSKPGAPSPAVYLHMQRRQLLRRMCSLILTYNRRHEFGLPVNIALHRDYPKAISSARSLLSHLSPLEAAGAIKRSGPRCECRAEECDDEPGSVDGITLIMHTLGFLDAQGRKAPARPRQPAPPRSETSSVDSGVDLDEGPMARASAGVIPNSGGPMVLPNSIDGEVSDIRLISELGVEGRVRMGRFQAELLEWKRLSVRLVAQRAESMKGQTGITTTNKNFPASWKADYKRYKKMPAKNFDLLRLRPLTTSGPSSLRNSWGSEPENPIYLQPQVSFRKSEIITIQLESDSRRSFRLDLEELRRSSSPWALAQSAADEAIPSSVYSLIIARAEANFGVPISRLKLKRGTAMIFSKSQFADEDTQFRDGDVLVCLEARLAKQASTQSLGRTPSGLSLSTSLGRGSLSDGRGYMTVPGPSKSSCSPDSPTTGAPGSLPSQPRVIHGSLGRAQSKDLKETPQSLSKSPKGSLLGNLISRGSRRFTFSPDGR